MLKWGDHSWLLLRSQLGAGTFQRVLLKPVMHLESDVLIMAQKEHNKKSLFPMVSVLVASVSPWEVCECHCSAVSQTCKFLSPCIPSLCTSLLKRSPKAEATVEHRVKF